MNQNFPAHPLFRRAVTVSTLTILFGAGTALAQSGGAGSSSYGAGQRSTNADKSSTSTTGTNANEQARRNTEPTVSADAKSTYEINAASGATSNEKLTWGDRRFVNKTADAGMAEVQLAQLAAQKASDPAVRAFAQKLVEQHTKVNSELTTLASQKGVMLDKEDGKDRAYNRLNRQTGAEFDQEFVEHMVEQHEDDIKRFEKASTNAKDANVRSFAAMHVSALRQHLQEAQSLQSTVAATGTTRQRARGTLSSPSGSYDTSTSGTATGTGSTTNPRTSTTSGANRPVDSTTPATPQRDTSR